MNQPAHNITRLPSNSVYSHIRSFLRSKGLKSANTSREYESDIRQFFQYMRNKSIEDLVIDDLRFVNSDIMDYQIYLSDEHISSTGQKYKNTSVNRKLASIASLYDFLKRNDYDINPEAMKVDPLPDDSKAYGILSLDEAEHMAELALTERESGESKRLLILLALRTSLRKEALLNLKWKDIIQNITDDNLYDIEVTDKERQDKGKKFKKQITKKMYTELISIKGEKREEDFIFNLASKYVNQMINRLSVKMGISKERRICFHSLKKTGINFVYEVTGGDIYAASSQASHSSISTTAKSYMKYQTNLAGSLMDNEIPDSIFDDVSKEELIQIIKSKNDLLYRVKQEIYKNEK